MKRFPIVIALLLIHPTWSQAEVFTSGPEQVGLLELYTSEGCSSCPPADRFLTRLVDHPGVFRDFIPLALHVDYWDYLGWRDRFADEDHSRRQRRYARLGGIKTVYTPGFVYNGEEWRRFFGGDTSVLPVGGDVGALTLTADSGQAEVVFEPLADVSAKLYVNVALLGFGLKSDVAAGENRGRNLSHDFVVLATRKSPLKRLTDDSYKRQLPLPTSPIKAQRYALVAWVSAGNQLAPLQATGGYLANDSAGD